MLKNKTKVWRHFLDIFLDLSQEAYTTWKSAASTKYYFLSKLHLVIYCPNFRKNCIIPRIGWKCVNCWNSTPTSEFINMKEKGAGTRSRVLAVHRKACLTTDAVNVCQKQDGIRLAFRELLSKLLLQICSYVTGQNWRQVKNFMLVWFVIPCVSYP